MKTYCIYHRGLMVYTHNCGAILCRECLFEWDFCPKCNKRIMYNMEKEKEKEKDRKIRKNNVKAQKKSCIEMIPEPLKDRNRKKDTKDFEIL